MKEPEIDHGVIVYHRGGIEQFVIEALVTNMTAGEAMVLYYARRGGERFVKTVDDFKQTFYMEDYDG